MSIYPTVKDVIPAKSQITFPTGIKLAIPKGYLAIISSGVNSSPRETLFFPGVLDPAYSDKSILMVGNLTDKPLLVNTKIHIAYLHLILADEIAGYRACSSIRDIDLPNPTFMLLLPLLMLNFLLLITPNSCYTQGI